MYSAARSLKDLQDWLTTRKTTEDEYSTKLQTSATDCPVEAISNQLTTLSQNHKNLSTGIERLISTLASFQKDNQNWESVLKFTQNPSQYKKYEVGFCKLTGLLQFQLDRLERAKEKNKGDKKIAEVNQELSNLTPKWTNEAKGLFNRFEEMERARLTLIKKLWDDYTVLLMVLDPAGAVTLKERMDGMNVDDELLAFCLSSGMEVEPPVPAEIPTVQVDAEGFAIKPENVDLFKVVKDKSDEEEDTPSPTKINVAIKNEAIVEDETTSQHVLQTVSTQLQKDRIRVNSEPVGGVPKTIVPYASSLPPLTASSSVDDIESTFYIIEKVNAYIHEGVVQNSLMTGELGINLFTLPSPKLKFDTQGLKNVIVNKQFLNDDLEFNMESLKQVQGSSVVLLKYQVDGEVPMIVPAFKVDEESISVLVDIKSNLKLETIKITVGFETSGEVGRVESSPVAQWDLDSKVLVWEVGPDCERLVGRVEGKELQPRPVVVEFEGSSTRGIVDGEMKLMNGIFTTVGKVFGV